MPVTTSVLPSSGPALASAGRADDRPLGHDADLDELAQDVARGLVGEPAAERRRDGRPDARDLGERVRLVGPDPAQLGLDGREPRIRHDVAVGRRVVVGSDALGQPRREVDGGLPADLRHARAR